MLSHSSSITTTSFGSEREGPKEASSSSNSVESTATTCSGFLTLIPHPWWGEHFTLTERMGHSRCAV